MIAPTKTALCSECGEPVELTADGQTRCGLCGAFVGPEDDLWLDEPDDDAAKKAAAVERMGRELDEINAKRKKFNLLSFALAIPGFVLSIGSQIASRIIKDNPLDDSLVVLAALLLVSLVGVCLLVAGFGCYAVYKGRHPAWGLLGLLSWIGLIVLACIPDHNKKRIEELTETLERMGNPLAASLR
ncbi:MAG: hypothetical protein AAF907_03530 [Planctomycetota bacterium]